MQKKRCTKCGKEFKAFNPKFEICPVCNSNKNVQKKGGMDMNDHHTVNSNRRNEDKSWNQRNPSTGNSSYKHKNIRDYLLNDFYSPSGAIKCDIYMDTSKNIASIFDAENLSQSSIRRFYESVRLAYDKYLLTRSFDHALEILCRLNPLTYKSEERGITKHCFTEFMEHYIKVAMKEERNLKGFKELFMSVIGYMKKNN